MNPRLRAWLGLALRGAGVLLGMAGLAILAGYVAMNMALEKDKVQVPNAIGMDLKDAAALLREVGLQPRMVAEEYSRTIPRGAVVSQVPSGGTRVRKNKEVRLTVSRGTDEILAPGVTGGPLTRAQRILAEHGMTVGLVARVHSGTFPGGEVIAQDPLPGFPARRGSAMNLLVSLGREEPYYVMPSLVGSRASDALAFLKRLNLEARVSYEPHFGWEGFVVTQDPPPG
ncbi:MAG TPA: PASTA domain-containing protein, partial [Candidatus Methylomirabilis sp.]|nr:PASTA domain-containing protein [Candidatus Methylomirabilis sp.]